MSFHAVFASETLLKSVYAQDSLRRITQITETIQGQTRKFNYLYDTAGRLPEMSRNDTLLAVYEYDADGNRLNHYCLAIEPNARGTGVIVRETIHPLAKLLPGTFRVATEISKIARPIQVVGLGYAGGVALDSVITCLNNPCCN